MKIKPVRISMESLQEMLNIALMRLPEEGEEEKHEIFITAEYLAGILEELLEFKNREKNL